MRLTSHIFVALLTFLLGIGFGFVWHRSSINKPQISIGETVKSAEVNNDKKQECSILSALKTEFQNRNPRISSVKIIDMRPTSFGGSKYLVLGWGLAADWTFKGNFEDELFGLFLVEGSLTQIEKVLDFIPTPRWLDTEMRITHVDADYVVLEAKADMYGYKLLKRKYSWRNIEQK